MRLLFTSTPGFGSFHPVVALARAARLAGHEVAFATAAERRTAVERLGITFFEAGGGSVAMRAEMRKRHPDVTLPPANFEDRKRVMRGLFGDLYIEAMLPGLLDACRNWQADVVVRAHLAYGGWIAAEECGLPYVAVEEYASGEPGWNIENLRPTISAWRQRRGLSPDPDLDGLHRYLMLAPFPAPLRDPGSPFGPTGRRIKPLIFSESRDDPLPDWLDALPAGPIVHASLGTAADRPELLRAFIDGLAGEPLTLVMTTGPVQDGSILEALPENVRVAAYIPHSQLLDRCDAIITHAGAGTLIASISAGLPMVFVPLFGDQLPNAERAVAAGAGILVEPADVTPESIREATRAVLREPRYRAAVKALRREIDALPSHEEAVSWIEQVARTKAPLPANT